MRNAPEPGTYWEAGRTIKCSVKNFKRTVVEVGDVVKILAIDGYANPSGKLCIAMVADGPRVGHQVSLTPKELKPVSPLKWLAMQAL